MMMKRLGIFVFYDPLGKVDKYIDALLSGLKEHIDKFIIIVNGEITLKGKSLLHKYSPHIFCRQNVGYDGGAYKDAFLKYLLDEDLSSWDEVIIFNDTFFAPICPWEPVFKKMEAEDADFWGLTKHPESGEFMSTGFKIPEHIQGYFIACRKNLVLNEAFFEFWKNLEYPKSYAEAVINFEIGFTTFFRNRGFIGKAYTDYYENETYMYLVDNPYISSPYELIKYFELPILKKKAIVATNFQQIVKVLEHIEKFSSYSSKLIDESIFRMIRENRMKAFNIPVLEYFQNKIDRIFLHRYEQKKTTLEGYYRCLKLYMPFIIMLGKFKGFIKKFSKARRK